MQVDGQGWMDHQWGNFVVAGGGGWDWFSLHLDDDADLMLYVIRGPDGSTTAAYGTLVQPDGAVRDLTPNDVRIETMNRWTSPHTGAQYPSGWRAPLADGQQSTVTPRILDQDAGLPGRRAQPGRTGKARGRDRRRSHRARVRRVRMGYAGMQKGATFSIRLRRQCEGSSRSN